MMSILFTGKRNGEQVQKPNSDLETVLDWTLYGAVHGDNLTVDGFQVGTADAPVAMPSYLYDWKLKAWVNLMPS